MMRSHSSQLHSTRGNYAANPIFRRGRNRAFTLVEAMLATVIVGVGTLGMLTLLASGTMANGNANDLMIGLNLANNIREMTQTSNTFSFSDITSPSHWGLETGETLATAD